jgi:hypothetical protein
MKLLATTFFETDAAGSVTFRVYINGTKDQSFRLDVKLTVGAEAHFLPACRR